MDDVSPVLCYHQTILFHHPFGGHKVKHGLICLFEKIRNPLKPQAERYYDNHYNNLIFYSKLKRLSITQYDQGSLCQNIKSFGGIMSIFIVGFPNNNKPFHVLQGIDQNHPLLTSMTMIAVARPSANMQSPATMETLTRPLLRDSRFLDR